MKKVLRKILLTVLTILGLLLVNRSAGQTMEPLKIKDAINMALSNNNALKADSMNLLMPGYQTKVLKADFLPQVTLNGKTEYNPAIATQQLPGYLVGQPSKETVPVKFGTSYAMGTGIEIKQSLFNKSTRIKLDAADLNQSIAETRHNLSREELVYEVAKSFYQLQANASLIENTTHDYENLRDILKIANSQFENGMLKQIDLETIEINTANKEAYLNELQTQYSQQLAKFNYLVGLPAKYPTQIDEEIRIIRPTLPDNSLLSQRQDIKLYNQLMESKQVDLRSIRAEGLPVISSYFRYAYQSQFNKASQAFEGDYRYSTSTIGISATLSLFDGFRRKNRANIARTELDQLKYEKLNQVQQAETESTTARQTLINNRLQQRITAQNLELAEKVFESRRALYNEGVTSLVELLDSERELTQSRNLQVKALIDVQTSQLEVYKAQGTLLTEFLNTL